MCIIRDLKHWTSGTWHDSLGKTPCMDKVNNSNFQKAFTLIELLVVITIIAILIAIILPVYSVVLENGRTTKCSSNLRQIGAAMFLYASDHNGYFPESGGTIPWGSLDPAPPGGSGQASWMEQLSIYMNTSSANASASAAGDPQFSNGKSIFICPSSSLVVPINKFYSYFNGGHAAYAVNKGPAALKQQAITFPTKHILSGDCNFNFPNGQLDADKDDYTQDPFDSGSKALFHRGSINLLFADGHVSNIKWSSKLSAYFDVTLMATHYSGTSLDDIANTGYITP